MKKILVIAVLVIGIGGFMYFNNMTDQTADPAASVPQAPSNNIGGDVNVCIGSADYCKGLVESEQQALEYQNEQFALQLTAMAPTPVPTKSPDEITRDNREQDARTNVMIVAFWAMVVIGILAGLSWIAWQLYWHFMIKAPRDESAPDIRESKDGQLLVARLPGDVNHVDARDQWLALDRNAKGAQLIHIDGNGIAHQLQLSDEAAKYVAIANAMSEAASRDQARVFMQSLLDQWTRSANSTIQTVGDAASKWRGSGRRQRVPSKMTQLAKPQSADGKKDTGDPSKTTATWS